MSRDYPLEKVRNFGIVAQVVATSTSLLENPRFSTLEQTNSLLSSTGKLQFSRHASSPAGEVRDPASRRRAPALRSGPTPISPLSNAVSNSIIFPNQRI